MHNDGSLASNDRTLIVSVLSRGGYVKFDCPAFYTYLEWKKINRATAHKNVSHLHKARVSSFIIQNCQSTKMCIDNWWQNILKCWLTLAWTHFIVLTLMELNLMRVAWCEWGVCCYRTGWSWLMVARSEPKASFTQIRTIPEQPQAHSDIFPTW